MNFHNLTAYDHYGYAIVAVVGTYAAVHVILWLMKHSPWTETIRSFHGVVPPFINVVGVLFGLTLAFIANDTWNAHDRATTAVYREADSLRSLMVLSGTLQEPLAGQLRQSLREVAISSADEWPLLAERKNSAHTMEAANALLILIGSPELLRQAGSNVQSLMLKKAADVRDERNLRVGLSQMHVNPLKWLGMAFLGFLTLLSIAAVHLDNPKAASVALIIFSLSAAPTAAIILIPGNPFQMPSSVSPAPLLTAVAR